MADLTLPPAFGQGGVRGLSAFAGTQLVLQDSVAIQLDLPLQKSCVFRQSERFGIWLHNRYARVCVKVL